MRDSCVKAPLQKCRWKRRQWIIKKTKTAAKVAIHSGNFLMVNQFSIHKQAIRNLYAY